jgi:molybdate transport system substrate-binding protein
MERVARRSTVDRIAHAAAASLLALIVLPLHALELRVLSAGAVEPGMRPALAAFERASGHAVRIDFAAAPALRDALRSAPAADVIVVPQGVVDELAATGAVGSGPRAPIGRVGVGVAVRPGVVPPDIASADALRAALVAAERVVYNRASTGLYVEQMLQRLGVDAVVRPKSERLADGASVMRRLLAGTSMREFGFGALTEIAVFTDEGLKLVGPLPAALQNYTTYVALPWPGVTPAESGRADAVAALMRSLQGAPARTMFSNAGIEPVPQAR